MSNKNYQKLRRSGAGPPHAAHRSPLTPGLPHATAEPPAGGARPSPSPRRTCDPRGPSALADPRCLIPHQPSLAAPQPLTASPAPLPLTHSLTIERPPVTHRRPRLTGPQPAPHSQPPPAFVAAAAEAFKALRRGEAGAAAEAREVPPPARLPRRARGILLAILRPSGTAVGRRSGSRRAAPGTAAVLPRPGERE